VQHPGHGRIVSAGVIEGDVMKRSIRIHWLAAGLLAATAFSAGAQSAGVSAGVEVRSDRAARTSAEDEDRVDRHCLRHTGSLISTRRHKRCIPAAGRVWTRDDLSRTGRTDMADALRALDPSIY